jgi:YD repeat-containing protein
VYGYDPAGRLLTVTRNGELVEEYRYDPDGTRIYMANDLRGINRPAISYSDEDNLISTGDAEYQYDLDGFLTRKTAGTEITDYLYASRGELLSVTLPDGRLVEYLHDPLGRRIAKLIDGEVIEKYLWQGATRLLAVYDGSDNLTMRFEYALIRMPVALTAEGATYYLA